MKLIYKILFLVTLFSINNVYAETDLYSDIVKAVYDDGAYKVVKTPTGIDLYSNETFTNSKGKVESITHLMLEGPLRAEQITSVEEGLMATAHFVESEVDSTFKNDNDLLEEIYPGLAVGMIDINGFKAGIARYKMNHEPNTLVNRAALHTEKGTYLFAMIMHQSGSENKDEMKFMATLIAAVNSGKL